MKARLAATNSGLADHLVPDTSKLDATKDLDVGAALLQRDKDNRYTAIGERNDWLAASPMLRALKDEERRIERLYWSGPPSDLAELKERARVLAGD